MNYKSVINNNKNQLYNTTLSEIINSHFKFYSITGTPQAFLSIYGLNTLLYNVRNSIKRVKINS
jgi:hypothetical protein